MAPAAVRASPFGSRMNQYAPPAADRPSAYLAADPYLGNSPAPCCAPHSSPGGRNACRLRSRCSVAHPPHRRGSASQAAETEGHLSAGVARSARWIEADSAVDRRFAYLREGVPQLQHLLEGCAGEVVFRLVHRELRANPKGVSREEHLLPGQRRDRRQGGELRLVASERRVARDDQGDADGDTDAVARRARGRVRGKQDDGNGQGSLRDLRGPLGEGTVAVAFPPLDAAKPPLLCAGRPSIIAQSRACGG